VHTLAVDMTAQGKDVLLLGKALRGQVGKGDIVKVRGIGLTGGSKQYLGHKPSPPLPIWFDTNIAIFILNMSSYNKLVIQKRQ